MVCLAIVGHSRWLPQLLRSQICFFCLFGQVIHQTAGTVDSVSLTLGYQNSSYHSKSGGEIAIVVSPRLCWNGKMIATHAFHCEFRSSSWSCDDVICCVRSCLAGCPAGTQALIRGVKRWSHIATACKTCRRCCAVNFKPSKLSVAVFVLVQSRVGRPRWTTTLTGPRCDLRQAVMQDD